MLSSLKINRSTADNSSTYNKKKSGKSKNTFKSNPRKHVFQKQKIQATVQALRKDVKAVLVSLPEKYRHDIQHKNQLLRIAAEKGKQWEDFNVDGILGEQL